MRLSRQQYDELVEHAQAEAPNECCGMIGVSDGEAVDVYPATNLEHSPLRFQIDGKDLLYTMELEQRGLDLVIYHSHTRTAPEPSQTDINYAANWPQALWLIIGLADGVEMRLWRIVDGTVAEAELAVA